MLFRKIIIDINQDAKVSMNDAFTNTAQFKSPLSNSENLFVSVIDVMLRDNKVGEFNICIPLSSVEDFIDELASHGKQETAKSAKDKLEELENETKVINSLVENKVPFEVKVELGKTAITVGELLMLNTDDVLILNKKIDEPVDVLVGGSLAYSAIPATLNNKKAIVISDLAIEKEEEETNGQKNN
jgi:flagellar motor switch protein FliM